MERLNGTHVESSSWHAHNGRLKFVWYGSYLIVNRGRAQGLTTLNKPKSREVSTNDGIITQNIFNAAVPTSIETK